MHGRSKVKLVSMAKQKLKWNSDPIRLGGGGGVQVGQFSFGSFDLDARASYTIVLLKKYKKILFFPKSAVLQADYALRAPDSGTHLRAKGFDVLIIIRI